MASNWGWQDEFGCGEQECQIQDLAIGKLERQAEWKGGVSQEDMEAQLLWDLVGVMESDSSNCTLGFHVYGISAINN